MVLADMFREKRAREKQRREEEAMAQGRAHVQALWESWLKRREDAERNNLPFNEPPPSLEESQNGSNV